jgi:TonB family protein
MIWAPPPEVAAPKSQPLPNVIAVEQRPLVKPFTAPAPRPQAPREAVLPDAPQVTAKLGAAAPGPSLRPLVRSFQAPEARPAAQAAAPLPDAPQFSASLGTAAPGPALRPLVKPFTPPPVSHDSAPAAPAADDAPAPADVPRFAVVGLDPAKNIDIPAPPAPHEAGFSAGPRLEPKGAETDGTSAAVTVPGLTVRGGARDAQPTIVPKLGPPNMKTLMAGVRAAPPGPAVPPVPEPRSAHVSAAPDPSLDGRLVYSIAIQMPNVTSYSGSWIVWFAERDPAAAPPAGGIRAPVPLRKVDPKYVASAVADGVQGVVRLSAVIRRTGRVDTIQLLRHLDDRLDASAIESLGKWEFEPALRSGAPLDVDAVFEIPFRLAPKPLK